MKLIKMALLGCLLIGAQGAYAGKLIIENGWVRAVPPVSKNTAAYFTLKNGSKKNESILHLSSDVSKHTELHTIVVEASGAKKMQKVPHASIKSGEDLELKPGGYHVMLIDLKKPLKEGDTVKLEMIFQHAGKTTLTLPVKMAGGDDQEKDSHHHHHH